jgi:hypothetical protein
MTQILIFLFFLSFLNTVRHLYFLLQTMIINYNNTNDDVEPIKYKLNEKELFLLGLSLSYILTLLVSLLI